MPLALSIISVCFRNPDELEATLRSMDGIDPSLCEVIIVDGSPDRSCAEVAARFPAFRHLHGPDTGKYNAMNKGIAAANGDAVLFMNSGDLLHDRARLEEALREHRDILATTILFGDVIRIVADERIYTPAEPPTPHRQRIAVFPSHQSIMMPRSYHLDHLFDERMFFAADSKMLRIAFDELPYRQLDFAIGEFAYGGACTSPGSWKRLRQQYDELLEVADYGLLEKAKVALSLMRRKVAHMTFGEDALQRAQAARLRHQLALRAAPGSGR